MAQLAQELIDAIVDELEDKDDLCTCALAARTFLHPSQRRLFRSLSLRWDGVSSRSAVLDRAVAFTDRFPHLIPHVREVSLDIPSNTENQVTLGRVLRMLGNIEHLTVHGRDMRWKRVVPALASTMSDILSLPTLERLELFRIGLISSAFVFHAASSVRALTLYCVSGGGGQDVLSDGRANTHLEGLFLPGWNSGRSLLRTCPFLLSAQNLRHLAGSYELGHHRTLTAASSLHLRYLELECGSFLYELNLPYLPALRSLSLSFAVSVRILQDDGPRVWSPELLQAAIMTLPTVAPNLDTLNFVVLVPSFYGSHVRWEKPSALPYFDIDSSTDYTQHLPQLRKINCVFQYENPLAPVSGLAHAYKAFAGYMEAKLAAAHAAGIVSVSRGN
ncbi:hypothetical protein C8R47DRAFT_1154708 [Mycena vitilis]|nr:hypothetical protein C8R47DRAFT_1154708 [Mycena vitilis]